MKNTLLLLIALVTGILAATAQTTEVYPFALQKNTFEPGSSNALLTTVLLPQNNNYKLGLKGKNAKWLSLKGNEVYLNKKFSGKAAAQKEIAFTVTLSESGRQVTEKTFTIIPAQFNTNKVIAHRGAWKKLHLPENSIASLKQAVALGCEGSEFDVHMTGDEVLVVNHDPTFMGLSIEKSTYADLLQKKMSNGETIPTLDSYLKAGIQQRTTRLVLEIKASVVSKERTLALTKKVVDMVHQHQAQAWVDYISFDYDACKKVLALDPAANVSYLNGDLAPDQLKKDGMYGLDYHFSVFVKHPEWIEQSQKLGLTINAWTVNDVVMMKQLLEQKADFITTNEPELLFETIKGGQ